jgi:hypothetical protein
MSEYTESQYRFTNPIRYFKSNDPIYYEVENIPLKQLQENDLWLKDQITSTEDRLSTFKTDVDRSNFTELKPYCDGGSNIVKVKPGRFTARINDAYNITPLQFLEKVLDGETATTFPYNESIYNTWTAKAASDPTISTIINKFRQQNIMSDALNMNGLVERAFSYPSRIPDRVSQFLASSLPVINNVEGAFSTKQPPYPKIQVQLWSNFTEPNALGPITKFEIKQYDNDNVNIGFASLGSAESEFIKRWRGVARTSIVDVPDELTIEIPRFDLNDFYYKDDSGNTVILNQATQRIDLLFIYSKPVDSSSVTLAKMNSTGNPEIITRAQLGLVRGAGVGVNFTTYTSRLKNLESGTNLDGSLKILPHISDQVGLNNGFKVSGIEIKGSFPSPDDLMNLTPILDEELTSTHFGLIGQSVLPIAYIVVKRSSTLSDGSNLITNSDIIDIRPFFRTTELSYNERAGIAAAVPAPSLANPVVTQAELDYELRKVYASLPPPTTTNTGGLTQPRPIAAGIIQGGFYYGPEGTMGRAIYVDNQTLQIEGIKNATKNLLNYPTNIPDLPDWEVAKWCDTAIISNITTPGQLPNDRINYFYLPSYDKNWDGLRFGSLISAPTDTADWKSSNILTRLGDGFDDFAQSGYRDPIKVYFVKKTIKLDIPQNLNVGYYNVNATFLNCTPITNQGLYDSNQTGSNTITQGIWIEKSKPSVNDPNNYFTVYVAWSPLSYLRPELNRSDKSLAGFAVINNYISLGSTRGNDAVMTNVLHFPTGATLNNHTANNTRPWAWSTSKRQAEIGLSIYPTVQFEVVGYPVGWSGMNTASLNNTNSVITAS